MEGKDIWLFGGGHLASGLMKANLVDSIEVSVMPVLLGAGTPLFQGSMTKVILKDQQTYKTGSCR
jgi:dihydrofolate reductase